MARKNNKTIDSMMKCDGGNIYFDDIPPIEEESFEEHYDNVLFMPFEDEVFFPYMQIGTVLSKPNLIATAKKALKEDLDVFFFYISDLDPKGSMAEEFPKIIYSRGCIGKIVELTPTEDGKMVMTAIMGERAVIVNLHRRAPYMRGNVLVSPPRKVLQNNEELAVDNRISEIYDKLVENLSDDDRKQFKNYYESIPSGTVRKLSFMIQNSPLSADERYDVLEGQDLSDVKRRFMNHLAAQAEKMKIRAEIVQKTMAEMGKRQKEDFLRNQMEQIRMELGDDDNEDLNSLKERASLKKWPKEAQEKFEKELRKLMRYNPSTADYAVQYSYLDTYLDLPWDNYDNSSFSLKQVREVLDRDHFGLEKVKERIVEQMAILKLRGDMRAPILCLYGPPGVGKTSLGKSVAEALGRKYERIALGGLHDEAEIRGHRRTYLGSMYGRILAALAKCGSSDPVIVLDEIDKIGADYKGDPSQALLEVLDPEQNFKFHDNYIDQDYDLSKVLFMATANSLSTVSAPLLDRMELIEVNGYVEEEKVQIAINHLWPKAIKEHGLESEKIDLDADAVRKIIEDYTRESGVRSLEKKLSKILRKLACYKANEENLPQRITPDMIERLLGKPEAFSDTYEGNEIPGVVTGLAWTQVGGEILFIESSVSPGKEEKLTLTGNLGDVMKESAILALQYIKANRNEIGISEEALKYGTVHIHVPEGAVPKDGPSAGITILTSLASTFTGRKVRSHLAMTGEMTLRGKVLPVGGIREKILAAKRAGIKTVMLSEKNRKDIEEIKPEYINGLEFIYVTTAQDVLSQALEP